MILTGWLIDGLLAFVLVALAVRLLWVRNLFHAVVLFISFGLLMALTWVRLAAPDVALAEAGIGAALTGVLLIEFLHRLGWQPAAASHGGHLADDRHLTLRDWPGHGLAAAAAAALGALLMSAILAAPAAPEGLGPAVAANLEHTGVEHSVTAVLLDFRSLDTLLELTVLFAAVLGALAVRRTQAGIEPVTAPVAHDAAVDALPKLLLPLLAMVVAYMLWLGSFAPGGAFQAGIVIAAAIVLLTLTGRTPLDRPEWQWKVLLVSGMATFLALGSGTRLAGRAWLDYPTEWSDALMLLLELAAAITIGLALALLFLGVSAPERWPISGSRRS